MTFESPKAKLLTAICEFPGWEPPVPCPAEMGRHLRELEAEGLIVSRLDGWEATEQALDRATPQPTEPIASPLEPKPILLSIGVGQRIEAPIEKGRVSGMVGLLNTNYTRVEVEVIVRVRNVDNRG